MMKHLIYILGLIFVFPAISQVTVDAPKNSTANWVDGTTWSTVTAPNSTDNVTWPNNRGGTLLVNSGETASANDFTVDFNGGGIITVDGGTLNISSDWIINNDLTINLDNDATVIVGGNLTAKNQLTINYGANCTNCSFTVTNFTADNNATIDLNGGGALDVNGDFTLSNGANVTVSSDSDLTIDGNLDVSPGGGSSVTVDGCATGDPCTEDGTLTVGGTIQDAGVVDGDGTIVTGDTSFPCPAGATCLDPNGNPLPVILSSFKAEQIKNYVKLTWKTESEINFREFALYHLQADGSGQMELDKIPSLGNSSGSTYSWAHENPQIGLNIYQIKSIDHDGYEELFEPVSVLFEPGNINTDAYPNPGRLQELKTDISTVFTVDVYSLSGEKVLTKEISNNDFSSLEGLVESGLYIFRFNINGLVKTQRIHIK